MNKIQPFPSIKCNTSLGFFFLSKWTIGYVFGELFNLTSITHGNDKIWFQELKNQNCVNLRDDDLFFLKDN